MQLGHGPLELAGLGRVEQEGVAAQLARVLRMLADERVHEPPAGVRQPPRLVLLAVLTGPLATAHERVKGGEDVERH